MLTPFVQDADFTLHVGDVREVLRGLPAGSVHTVVTSPPYWGLRDYGTGSWTGGDEDCDHSPEQRGGRFSTAVSAKQASNTGSGTMSSRDCPCGAIRADQQLGLEPTPEAYVAAMVDVFREVRRVLRDDGTLWLNLGDSYAGSSMDGGPASSSTLVGTHHTERDGARFQSKRDLGGLKPKDLVGIPWRVAFALQQPYYTGTIKDERDRIWLAAMIDAEGCIHIHKRSAGTNAHSSFTKADGTVSEYVRKNDTYGVMVTIDNTSKAIIDRAYEIVGRGARYSDPANSGVQQRKQELYRLTLTGNQARELLRELYPHLVAKQQQARIAYHSPKNGDGASRAHVAIKDLHNGRPTAHDAPAPPTLFEPGWYLRSEIVWAKSNPMPESVTDRPTKSHEQVFLLTKSPRYFFDQEAVREPHSSNALERSLNPHDSYGDGIGNGENSIKVGVVGAHPNGRNIRSVWEIATQPYPEAHFATFPEALPDRCIRAGTSERGCCSECGAPWKREVEQTGFVRDRWSSFNALAEEVGGTHRERTHRAVLATTGWLPTCKCGLEDGDETSFDAAGRSRLGDLLERGTRPELDGLVGSEANAITQVRGGDRGALVSPASEGSREVEWPGRQPKAPPRPVPCTVLDPFMGSGTTALVARRLGRRSVGIELNPEYAELCARRLQQQSLFAVEHG